MATKFSLQAGVLLALWPPHLLLVFVAAQRAQDLHPLHVRDERQLDRGAEQKARGVGRMTTPPIMSTRIDIPRPDPRDISPLFPGANDAEWSIAQRLIKLEGTPEAIREFCRSRGKLRDYHYWF